MPKKVEISHRTIIFTVLFLISLYFLYQIRQILVVLFISFVLMSAFNPVVNKLEKLKIPRLLGIIIVYLLVILGLGVSIAGVIPPLVDQTATLISRLPDYFQNLRLPAIDQDIISSQINQLGSIPANLLKITVNIFNNFTALLVIAVVTFYFLIERKNLDHYLAVLFGGDGKDKARAFIDKLERRLGGWVRAQLTLMVIIGVMSYIGLRLLGIEFALPLAILAGILEIVPNIGPVLSAIPAVLAGLVISPLMGLAVAALYFLVQQLENTLIVPQIMAREVGVRPLVVIISLAIGVELGGFIGVVLAIPFVLLLQIAFSEFFSSKRFKGL
ncbi:MAG TPA: AI-2E family transporter [Nevskiaceae bacterium]|nr:AI-2E family transporter [Nevskiaceae bacterium]